MLSRVLASLLLPALAAPPAGACPASFFDPAAPGTVYVRYGSGGLFKSTDNGGTWTETGRFAGYPGDLVFDPLNPRTLYAVSGSGVAKSLDAGAKWVPAGRVKDEVIAAITIDPRTPRIRFASASHFNDPAPRRSLVYKSVDAGARWTLGNAGLPNGGVWVIRVSPHNSNVVYTGTNSGVFKTTDSVKRWRPSNAGIADRTIDRIVIDLEAPETLYVTASRKSDWGVFKSTNGGRTWTDASAGLPGIELMDLVGEPLRPEVLYAASRGRGLYRTTDAGARWTRVALPNEYPCAVAVSPHDARVILVGTIGDSREGYSSLLYKSVDGGTRWEILGQAQGLPSISTIADRRGGVAQSVVASR